MRGSLREGLAKWVSFWNAWLRSFYDLIFNSLRPHRTNHGQKFWSITFLPAIERPKILRSRSQPNQFSSAIFIVWLITELKFWIFCIKSNNKFQNEVFNFKFHYYELFASKNFCSDLAHRTNWHIWLGHLFACQSIRNKRTLRWRRLKILKNI